MSEIQSKSQLINYFNQGAKKDDQLLIGVEHEKILFTGKKKKEPTMIKLKKFLKI